MRTSHAVAAMFAALVAGAAGTWLALREHAAQPAAEPGARAPGAAAERPVLYWYDPMYPDRRFDKPGKSPFMDMILVPKYADDAASAGSVAIDARAAQNLGVRTVAARRGRLARTVAAVGTVAFDERAVSVVQARVPAIVERLHVRAPLDRVAAGAPLVTLLAPEWTAAQEEYLAVRRARAPDLGALAQAARQRLVLLGMGEAEIRALERRGRSDPRTVVRAPRDGVLAELAVREGAAVAAGDVLARVNGLDTVWINAAIPERDVDGLAGGTPVTAAVAAYPDETFTGAIEALLPTVDAATRTLTARIALDNRAGRLVPGMYASVTIAPESAAPERVLVPEEAVIATGERDVVIVAEAAGRFRAQEVRAGRTAGGATEILAGLDGSERLVASGQFLIDSEARLGGALQRLDGADAAPAHTHEPERTP